MPRLSDLQGFTKAALTLYIVIHCFRQVDSFRPRGLCEYVGVCDRSVWHVNIKGEDNTTSSVVIICCSGQPIDYQTLLFLRVHWRLLPSSE